MFGARIAQANEKIVALLKRLSPEWTEIDTYQSDRLDNAGKPSSNPSLEVG